MSTTETDTETRHPPRLAAATRTAAPVVVALLAGGGVVFALEHHGGSTAASAAAGTTPALAAGASPGGASSGGAGGLGGGVAGEQHVQGTVRAKSADTVTVASSAGTATYTVGVTTEIVRDGRRATLAEIQVGDPVLVHVYPSSSGTMLVERLLAGSSATVAGPGGFGPPQQGQGFGGGTGAGAPTA